MATLAKRCFSSVVGWIGEPNTRSARTFVSALETLIKPPTVSARVSSLPTASSKRVVRCRSLFERPASSSLARPWRRMPRFNWRKSTPMSDLVTIAITDHVADVRLNRPEKMNALNLAMFDAIAAAAERVMGDHTVRAVVLSGEGNAFCSGLDTANFTDPNALGGA